MVINRKSQADGLRPVILSEIPFFASYYSYHGGADPPFGSLTGIFLSRKCRIVLKRKIKLKMEFQEECSDHLSKGLLKHSWEELSIPRRS